MKNYDYKKKQTKIYFGMREVLGFSRGTKSN